MPFAMPPGPPVSIVASVRHGICSLAAVMLVAAQLVAGAAFAAGLLDGNEDFKRLATAGFEQAVDGLHPEGSQFNDYAWSMAWFKGKLYVGTGSLTVDPASGQPRAGQIWAYTPGGSDGASGTWALAYRAPDFLGLGPREFGYRWMTSCTFRGTEYLFISTLGALQGNILYTVDGVNYSPVSRSGIPAGSAGFRTMVCFTEASGKRTLITSPIGKTGFDPSTFESDESDNPVALANDDPTGGGPWRNYSPMRMGDPDNLALFSMNDAGGWLYAGVTNRATGAQLWRTRGCSNSRINCVPTWTKLIDRGGGRPRDANGILGNRWVSDIAAYGDAVYLGVGAPVLDGDFIRAEFWRVRADGTTEIVVGEPRLNFGIDPNAAPTNPAFPPTLRCGLPLEDIDGIGGANDCPPTSRRGAGYGFVSNAAGRYPTGSQYYFWRIFNYAYHATNAPLGDNRLYVGTFQGFGGGQNTPGFDLLATTNGVDFTTVSGSGLGNLQQQGVRSIAATPFGLGVGGTHFRIGYTGETFGCDVWLGAPLPDSKPPVTTLTSPPSPLEGSTLGVHTASFAWTATDTPSPGSLPLTFAYRLHPLEPAFSAFGATTTRTYPSLLNGTYTFYVIAQDAAGNVEAAGSAPGAGNRRTFTVSAPDAPPTVAIQVSPASPNSTGNVTLAWLGSDDLTPAASLVYDYWLAPPASDQGVFVSSTTRSYNGLADGTYTFHVKAKDGAGNVGAEATATFDVVHPPPPPAGPASASAAVNAPPRGIRVTWTDVATETGYNIQRCQVGRACSYAPIVSNLPANTTFYDDTISAASPAGVYSYRVQACNSGGCSAWVNTNNVTVP
ncbi:MAG: hypothetical protein ABI624_01480 [Casimicrobiaceae bacterium]